MKKIQVVIGSNYGDEGKGQMVDFLSHNIENGVVVRFNGGCQAGHTVTTPDSLRHVFGSFGAGSFNGVPTFLGKHFVFNPIRFMQEWEIVKNIEPRPRVLIDHRCIVTTPYDMMINQIMEHSRGDERHGSCGVGVHETILRSEMEEYKIVVGDFNNLDVVEEKLKVIRDDTFGYISKRLDMETVPENYKGYFANDTILRQYLKDIENLMEVVTISDEAFLENFDHIIFEGAQGLLLDQNHKNFPHVTHSNTGIKNVVETLKEVGLDSEGVEIIYVTRPYLTRHGAGPLPNECDKPYSRINDLTNVPNLYQGVLRFATLDIDELTNTILEDLKNAEGLNYEVSLAVTCLDHVGVKIKCIIGGDAVDMNEIVFTEHIMKRINAVGLYTSNGMNRECVDKID